MPHPTPAAPKRYSPVAAVTQAGDNWLFAEALDDTLSNDTRLSLYSQGPDADDYASMQLLRKGTLPRVI